MKNTIKYFIVDELMGYEASQYATFEFRSNVHIEALGVRIFPEYVRASYKNKVSGLVTRIYSIDSKKVELPTDLSDEGMIDWERKVQALRK